MQVDLLYTADFVEPPCAVSVSRQFFSRKTKRVWPVQTLVFLAIKSSLMGRGGLLVGQGGGGGSSRKILFSVIDRRIMHRV